jgi:hypothetical protein
VQTREPSHIKAPALPEASPNAVKRGRVFPVKKYLKKFGILSAVIHIAENPAENVREWNLSPSLG